jgi:hypothetical protein
MAKVEKEIDEVMPEEHLFFSGPDGGGKSDINAAWAGVICQFFETVKNIIGPNPSGQFRPYRYSGYIFLRADFEGENGTVIVTIKEARSMYGGGLYIPVFSEDDDDDEEKGFLLIGSGFVCEPVVADAVDAFYLASSLARFLGLDGPEIRLKAGHQ